MASSVAAPGVFPGRLPAEQYEDNFADLHPPLSKHEAAVAADRCYFCHDAPCVDACPTEIDIPLFIRQIASGVPDAAAKTIFDSNILGGMCARVCPTETLCEEACVRETAEGSPVEIGRLQRFATDSLMAREGHPYERSDPTGKRIAVVGAGPAGLACAHRLAMKGHDVVIVEARSKAGGLNEYGIAAYKTVENFAAREVEWLLRIGGISIKLESPVTSKNDFRKLCAEFDAVFVGCGLDGVNKLDIDDENACLESAVDFISDLRQADDLSALPVGRNVVVIGGGMTAIDAAVQSKLLGAEEVTIAYRRSRNEMGASKYEQDLAASKGVRFLANAEPVSVESENGAKTIFFERTESSGDGLAFAGEVVRVPADQIFQAIGQRLERIPSGLETDGKKLKADAKGKSGLPNVWAGGDCIFAGEDLTVSAVAQGRDAAEEIHAALSGC